MLAQLELDLEYVVRHQLRQAIDGGYPPRRLENWLRHVRKELVQQEEDEPGYISRVATGLRARADGKRVTGWREVRGTHSISHVPDPSGTDRPPWL